jgi:D-glycero-D-manno-heptose 1,7-bisphosphate phosphatase
MSCAAVFLDRDGVINKAMVRLGKPYPPASLTELDILPRVLEALERLKRNDFFLVVVSNQPDVVRGKTSRAEVEAINAKLTRALPIDDFRICYHDTSDDCNCRKPKPGMLIAAARCWNIDLSSSYMVGDRWGDIEAGQRAGCKTFFVDYGYDEKRPETFDYCVKSLWDAACIICPK